MREKECKLREKRQLITPITDTIDVLLDEYREDLDKEEMTEALITVEDSLKARLFLLLHGKRDQNIMKKWLEASAKRR